jgi:hypothetical protein
VAEVGTGLTAGTYKYSYTDVTAAGESLPSPLATVAVGVVAAPASAPFGFVLPGASGPDYGTHQYAVTFTTAAGETTPSPLSGVVTTGIVASSSPGVPTYSEHFTGGSVNDENWFTYVTTGVGNNGSETSYGGGHQHYLSTGNRTIRVYKNGDGYGCSATKLYRSAAGGNPPYKYVGTFAGAYFDDTLAAARSARRCPQQWPRTWGVSAPVRHHRRGGGAGSQGVSNGGRLTAQTASAPSPITGDRHRYGRRRVLGADAPTSNTAGAGCCKVAPGVAIGPRTTAQTYRTVANGSQLKLLATRRTTPRQCTDNVTDASLRGNVRRRYPASRTDGRVVVARSPFHCRDRRVIAAAAGPSSTANN